MYGTFYAPRKTVRQPTRPYHTYRLYQAYQQSPMQALDDYVEVLELMRDRSVRVGYNVSDYEASVHLLETVTEPNQGLAQMVFDDLFEVDSRGRRDINYAEFGRRLVRVWRNRQLLRARAQEHEQRAQTLEARSQSLVARAAELEEQSRRLLREAAEQRNRARPYTQRAVEHRERAVQVLEEAGEEAPETEPMEWFETIRRMEESGVNIPHRVGLYPALDVDGRESQGSRRLPAEGDRD
jgi:hypothetical protein